MPNEAEQQSLPLLITSDDGRSIWSQSHWPIETRGGMQISPRIDCSSLRLRISEPGYASDWHVAGDPTLIVVRSGQLRLVLRDGLTRDFKPGEAFIAADQVPAGEAYNDTIHGHRAEVVGDELFEAVHIKLTDALD